MSKLAFGTLALLCLAAPTAAEPFRKVLISSRENIRVDQAEITAKDATPKCPIQGMELTLHGKIANLPAQEVELVVDREPPYRLRLRGRVDERMLFGLKLE